MKKILTILGLGTLAGALLLGSNNLAKSGTESLTARIHDEISQVRATRLEGLYDTATLHYGEAKEMIDNARHDANSAERIYTFNDRQIKDLYARLDRARVIQSTNNINFDSRYPYGKK